MESLLIVAAVAFLAGPILALVALAKWSDADRRIRRLQSDLDKLRADLLQRQLQQPATPAATQQAKAEAPPPPQKAAAESRGAAAPAKRSAPSTDENAAPPAPSVAAAAQQAAKQAAPKWSKVSPPRVAQRNVEQAVASRWFVWVGGIAIALGGLLFVKYAHDNGLIPPVLRVIIGLAFAGALVAAGDALLRHRPAFLNQPSADQKDYIPAALSAAGIVIAFGVIYAAYALYGLLSPLVCFPALVAIGLGALWLSRRQGPLIAALGLLGAYAAPALVPSEHPSPLGFFIYLAVVLLAALYELRNRPWWWLGYAAIAGAAAWALLWVQGSFFAPGQALPVGVFALVLGAGATLVPRGRAILEPAMGSLAAPQAMAPPMQIAVAGAAAASVILAATVTHSLHAPLALVMFAIGMAALTAFGWRRDGLVVAPLAAAAVTLVVLMVWNDVGFHEWAMDERGMWSTVPGLIQPPRFRNAMLVALVAFTAVGLAGTWLKVEKRPWAALASFSAVLFLLGAWGRADFTLSNTTWAILAVALAAALKAVAFMLRPGNGDVRTAQAVEALLAGLALLGLFAADRLLDGVWYTIAVAAMAAAMAYATRIWPLPYVGGMASLLAAFAAVRLFIGREFWAETPDLPLGAHWVLYGYGVPAALLWQGSRWLKGDTNMRWRVALEGVSLGLLISLVSLELRVLIGGGITADHMTLLELSAHALAWMGAAYGLAYRQSLYSGFVSLWGARVLLAASCLAVLAALTVRNPVATHDMVEGGQIINSLWLAYLAPVALLALIAPKLEGLGLARLRPALGAFALVLFMAFITLWVKRQFQGPYMEGGFATQGESYAVSLAWLVSGILAFIAGLRLDRQTLRYGALAILALTVMKVFALDLFALGGLWRIASIIGLGACLIGVGWLYTRFIQKKPAEG